MFLIVVFQALQLGQTELLNDPGTFWHVRVGMDVLESGPPHVDRYSFTRAGEPWISQHWLCDVLFAWLYRARSWDGLVVWAALMLGWTYRLLFRVVLRAGANVAWAVVLTLLAAGCGAPHWLARPHLFSLLFLLVTFDRCRAYHRDGHLAVWLIPFVMAFWCNVHGAFLAGLAVVGCSLVGHLLTAPRDGEWRRRAIGFVAVLAVSIAATLFNPYGWRLHAHLRDILFSSQVRDLIDEWRAPDFQSPDARPLEALILVTIVLLAVGRLRVRLFSLLHLVVWIHWGLLAVRQVPFLALVAAPLLAELTPELASALSDQFGFTRGVAWLERVGSRAAEWASQERAACWPIWSAVATIALVAVTLGGVEVRPLAVGLARPSPEKWPIVAVERLNTEPGQGPVFHDLGFGGYLILKADPARPVFCDDRFELYGREFLLDYLDALQYGPSWQALLDRYEFEFVLARPDSPLARVLSGSSEWRVLHEDRTAVLLRRAENGS